MIIDAVESLYYDICDVYEYAESTDEVTHQTKQGEVLIYENIPCRLVYKSKTANGVANGAENIEQSTELIINPRYEIKDGSVIYVTKKDGQRVKYKSSGEPAYYPTHQEIMLKLFGRWA